MTCVIPGVARDARYGHATLRDMGPSGVPPGYALRPPTVYEASDVDRLGTASDAAVGSAPSLTEGLIRSMWRRPHFELGTDAWVVENDHGLVGYAQVWDEDSTRLSAFAIVHPDHTGRGIGSALAARIEERAAAKVPGDARLFSAVLTQDESGARLLVARGYAWARRFWHMEIELDGVPRVTPPSGVQLRALDPDRELPAVHRILEEAFSDSLGSRADLVRGVSRGQRSRR